MPFYSGCWWHKLNKQGKKQKLQNPLWIKEDPYYLLFKSFLLCLIAIESVSIEGTHIPTKIPSNLFPLNHKLTDSKNEKNASIIG